MRTRNLLPILLLASLTACDNASASDESNADAAPRLALEEIRRIGSVDDPDVGFATIGSVDEDRDGNLFVFESQARHLRVYGTDGTLLRTMGRPGQGPGEFRSTPRFGVVGDTVWTFQGFPRLLALFDREGNLLHTARIEGLTIPLQGGMNGVSLPHVMREDGRFVSDMSLFMSNRGATSTGNNDTVQVPRVLFDASGNVVDTLGFSMRPPPPERPRFDFVEIGSQRYMVPTPPTDAPLDVTFDDGTVVVTRATATSAEPAAFTVTRLDFAGDTVVHRAYSYTPKPFGEAALDSLAMRSLSGVGGIVAFIDGAAVRTEPPDDIDAALGLMRTRMSFPAFQPPVQAWFSGADGSVWLRREEMGADTYDWLIIDPAGELRGTVTLDREVRPVWASGDEAWLIEPDELDVPWLVKYRIGPG